jgi:cobalt-zinc-cadmium efflux system outer membrane protein
LFLLLAWSAAAGAAPAPATSASVHRLLARPAELSARLAAANPDVAAARARVSEARAEASGSRLLPNPVLDASLSAIPVSHANDARFATCSVWSVGLSETVELGKRGPRSAAADSRARAASHYLVSTLGERVASARAAMASALHLSLRNATLEASLRDAEHATELERVRYEQKALSGMDYDRLLLELASLEAELAKSRAEYQGALAECGALLAGSCNLDDAREDDLDQALPLAGLAAESPELGKRPDLVGLSLERDAAQSDAELARRRGIPDVTVHVGYTRDNSAGPEEALDSVSVGLQLPLPIADHGQHEASKALARASELEEQHRAVLLGARAELSALLEKKRALEHTLSVLERDSLPRAKSVLESTQRAFDDGGIALTDFLLARRSYVALRLTLLEQRFELFSTRNELYRVLGLDAQSHENQ